MTRTISDISSADLARDVQENREEIADLDRKIARLQEQIKNAEQWRRSLSLTNLHMEQVLEWRRRTGRADGDIVSDFARLTEEDIGRDNARLVELAGAIEVSGDNGEYFAITALTLTFETATERIAVTFQVDNEREADYIQVQMSTGVAFLSDVKPEAVNIPAGGYDTIYYADERHVFVASSDESVLEFGEPDELRIDSTAEPISVVRMPKA